MLWILYTFILTQTNLLLTAIENDWNIKKNYYRIILHKLEISECKFYLVGTNKLFVE